MRIQETMLELKAVRDEASALRARAASDNRDMTAAENSAYNAKAGRALFLEENIREVQSSNTLAQFDPVAMMSGRLVKRNELEQEEANTVKNVTVDHPKAAALKRQFGAWARRSMGSITGMPVPSPDADAWQPEMGASAPSGIISVGAGTGLDSVGFAVPTQILPFMKSYFAFSPFEKAGSSLISTDHMRSINLPILSAGATPTAYPEGQGPVAGTSQPMGLSGFTFGANKKSRQVIADYESLMSTEAPLQPMIIDELLVSIANALTKDATTALFNALTAPPNYTITGGLAPLQIGGSSVTADVYGQLTGLRHGLVEGLEDNTNSFMLSRSTLAIIRNTRATTSGVPMFDPEQDLVLGRPYVVNEFFDSVCGAGFVAYGNWNKGAWLRRTPIITRVLQELYWATNTSIGFVATTWGDNHFLAELVGAVNPPTNQPLFYTVLPAGALQ
ncbi:MAG: phage major capsid protein [Terracidiphilus sp.]